MVRFWFGVLVRSNSSDSGSVRPNQKKGGSVVHYYLQRQVPLLIGAGCQHLSLSGKGWDENVVANSNNFKLKNSLAFPKSVDGKHDNKWKLF